MGSIGTNLRNIATRVISHLGSSVTITPYTISTSDYGHTGQVETSGTAVSTTAVPFEEMKNIVKDNFGDLETGQIMLAMDYTETFDTSGSTKYKITYNSDVYDSVNARRYYFQSVLVCWILTLSKRFD